MFKRLIRTSASHTSEFFGVATDTYGNVYAVGDTRNNAAYGFGNGVTATSAYNGNNGIIVEYTQ